MHCKVLFLLLLFVSPALSIAQKQVKPIMNYKRYEGKIGDDISITANIIRIDSKLSGNYQYRFVENNTDMYFGRTIEVKGTINKDNFVQLKEFGRDEFAFNGSISGDIFSGTWNAPNNKKLPFEMKVFFPNGSMPFIVYFLQSENKLVEKQPNSPIYKIELMLLFPEIYFNPVVIDSVKKVIVKSFFGPGFQVGEPELMMKQFKEENIKNYREQNADWHSKGASFNWEQMISMSVTFNSNYLLCLEYLKYAFTGGAHGMTNVSYDIINLEDGKLLTYADIFNEGTDEQLAELLTNQLRKDYQIPENVPLSKAGFFVDVVRPNRNIYVNGNGVGFLYNSYEIAPYSQGSTNIFLEFNQIKELVRQGTPVFTMSKR